MVEDRTFSRAEVQEGVQAALAMCATCAHTRGDHPSDADCTVTREETISGEGSKPRKRVIPCLCREYWPLRNERVDGLPVANRHVKFAGRVALELNRRITTEFWDGLKQGGRVMLMVAGSVSGKGFGEKDFALTEARRVVVEDVYFPEPDSGRVFDVFGNTVDPETGEVLGGEE